MYVLEQPCVLNCYRRVHIPIPAVRRCQYLAGTMMERTNVNWVWNVMAHPQKPNFVFWRNGRVHLNRLGASVQSTTGSRVVRISGSNAGYTMFRGSVKSTGYPLHSPVSSSLPLPCVIVCHHISTGLYLPWCFWCCMFQQNRMSNQWRVVIPLCSKTPGHPTVDKSTSALTDRLFRSTEIERFCVFWCANAWNLHFANVLYFYGGQ